MPRNDYPHIAQEELARLAWMRKLPLRELDALLEGMALDKQQHSQESA